MSNRNPENVSKREQIFLYVPHAWAKKALEIGWVLAGDLGPPHNNYSILMEWKKDDKPVMPFKTRGERYER